jgi:hypothetical protein
VAWHLHFSPSLHSLDGSVCSGLFLRFSFFSWALLVLESTEVGIFEDWQFGFCFVSKDPWFLCFQHCQRLSSLAA